MNQGKKKVQVDQGILTGLTPFIKNNRIDCESAHQAANQLGVTPLEIGRQLDLQGCKIVQCQLGLFGYGKQKKLDPDIIISPLLDKKISSVQVDTIIACLTCWQLANELSISRLDFGSACDKKGLRIKPCQLGIF